MRTTEFDGGPVRVASLSTLPTLGIVVVSLALIVQMVMRRRRRYPRRLCRIPAILLHGEHCTFTHLIDIGRGGAKLEAPYVPVPPGTMSLLMGDLRVDCRMVWCSSLYLGVRFDRPLSAEQERSIRDDADSDLNAITVSDCHFPTCQHACARHRATAIETRRAAALLPHPAPPG